ncbi:MAG: cytochrome C oxidase subunit IV family protein [Leptospiraceae bacterium]|nr:cytochrome C oxidase subunit IV family protein [Leptospiraceae bacterium]
MEVLINYSLYAIACICIMVPLFGFGISPPLIIKAALGLFAGNSYSLIVEQKILKNFIKENEGNSKLAPVLPALQNAQQLIDEIEDPSLKKKEEHDPHAHHIIPIPVYVGVLMVLLLGTVITVWIAQFDFGAWNTIIAMFVATIKASFVLGFFMHLKYDNMMNRVIFMSGFLFLAILIGFSAADIFTRFKMIPGF